MTDLSSRKIDHLELCKTLPVEHSRRDTGLGYINLLPAALAEFDFSEIDISTNFLGKNFASPLFITGMTGGPKETETVNFRLAELASTHGLLMGVGSQRVALDDKNLQKSFQLKKKFPKLFLVGNLGFGQLCQSNALHICKQAIEMIEADALAIHLNLLQELVQEQGDRKFKNFLSNIAEVCGELSAPVLVKDVGCGLDVSTFYKLRGSGAAAVDVGGSGGTSWSYIEGLRSQSLQHQTTGKTFQDWGIPTAYALKNIRDFDTKFPVSATGGVRSGLDIAKLLGLGANMVGVGLPFLKASLQSPETLEEIYQTFIHELKVAMMCSGAKNCSQLAQKVRFNSQFRENLSLFV